MFWIHGFRFEGLRFIWRVLKITVLFWIRSPNLGRGAAKRGLRKGASILTAPPPSPCMLDLYCARSGARGFGIYTRFRHWGYDLGGP